jgi:hypothetical protein
MPGNGRWVSMTLKKPKGKGAQGKKKKSVATTSPTSKEDEDSGDDDEEHEVTEVGFHFALRAHCLSHIQGFSVCW